MIFKKLALTQELVTLQLCEYRD